MDELTNSMENLHINDNNKNLIEKFLKLNINDYIDTIVRTPMNPDTKKTTVDEVVHKIVNNMKTISVKPTFIEITKSNNQVIRLPLLRKCGLYENKMEITPWVNSF
jgi:hypothetical protein